MTRKNVDRIYVCQDEKNDDIFLLVLRLRFKRYCCESTYNSLNKLGNMKLSQQSL